MYTMCAQWLQRSEGIGSPGTKVTDSCELSCGCWDLTPTPLEKQPVCLTAESFLQAPS